MISPLSRQRYQEKRQTYSAASDTEFGAPSSWQQARGGHFDNEQLDLDNRALSYNPSYAGAGSESDQLLDPQLRRNQSLRTNLSPDSSSFRISQTQNGSENFTENPYSRAPYATMTSSNPAGLLVKDVQPREPGIILPQPSPDSNGSSEGGKASHPDARQLPPRDVTIDTIEEAYVSFISFCNPSVPLSTDTAELRRGFHSPPKSDGKTFKTFTLFDLIRKLEMKELKTWAQLAIELGVEPPVLEKGQSAQKVQQYAVRLKRWMHAMHVDAFFEYLLGKSHVYWTQIPSLADGAPEFGRDGVPSEEDLALRALLPETRPKRGRRKAEDRENDFEDSRSPAQRPRLHSPTLSDDYALARSAHPEMRRYDDVSPWSSEPRPSSVQNMRWRPDEPDTPLSAHPQSAIVSRTSNPYIVPENEPRSAATPTTSRSRRRHGPAVSSAWPSSGNGSSGKLRGRPPSNRSITDGPYSTFPAKPNTKSGQTINYRENTAPLETPGIERTEEPMFTYPPTFNRDWREKNPQASSKRAELHLQVPERVGGPVRLATPPTPIVIVNGGAENSENQSSNLTHKRSASVLPPHPLTPNPSHKQGNNVMEYLSATRREELRQEELRREELHQSINNPSPQNHSQNPVTSTNSNHPLPQTTSAPSKQPSQVSAASAATTTATPTPIPISYKDEPGPDDRTNIDDLESHFRLRVLSAEWTDVNGQPSPPCDLETANKIVKQTIRNLRDESTSQEAFLINLAALAGGRTLMTKLRMKVIKIEEWEGVKKTVFESRWTLKFGAVEGSFTIQQIIKEVASSKLSGENELLRSERNGTVEELQNGSNHGILEKGDIGGGGGDEDDAKTWKRKYMELQNRFYQKDDRVWSIRKSVLEALASTENEHVV